MTVGCVVFIAASIGILLRPSGHLSTFWAANAVLLGLLVRRPDLAVPMGWVGAAAALVAADALNGSSWARTLLLAVGNLAGVLTGYLLFKRLAPEDRLLLRPSSLLAVTMIALAASAATSVFGASVNALIYHRNALNGFFIWLATELANYIVVLPVVLTFPRPTALKRWLVQTFTTRPNLRALAPLLAYVVSLALVPAVGGPGALAFPVPTLLWCALTYSLAATTLLTLSFAVWTLLFLSNASASMGFAAVMGFDLMSLRLGVMLVALGPVTVASVMAGRNALLREANLARHAAEEAMAARTLLLATMTHELRSPLTAVVGFSAMMSRQAFGPIGHAKYLDYAQSIEIAGSHLNELVSDLLDTAKIEAGQIELAPTPVSSREVVEQSLRLVRGLAIDAGVNVVMEPGDWPQVHADQRAIKQILINLLANAVKFSPPTGLVEVSSDIQDGRLMICVKDFGPGIREEDLALLGRPYVQMGDKLSRPEGWGLGLALSQELIEQHGGRLRLESQLGAGTRACFDLPLAPGLSA
ncbi:ATP-binding protein [Phenylobacterium sp.]|uniref:sensor histidine kinase n=1 Tax=Phenylobacterium sp. TaxID=1871053 RepID=UPI00289BA9CA|nr:ATP-binding protein [Phenylobacterium sp.]